MAGRRTQVLACLCGLLLLGAALPDARPATPAARMIPRGVVAPGQLLLVFDPDLAEWERDAAIGAYNGRTLRTFPSTNARLVAVAPGVSLLEQAAAYSKDRRIRFSEPNFTIQAAAPPDDPSFVNGDQWALRNTGQAVDGVPGVVGADISAVAAWDVTTGDPSIVVGLLDTGIDYDHPDLAGNIWRAPPGWTLRGCAAGSAGYDAIGLDCDPQDDNGHGTAVAGVVGATGNNGAGVAGVNWRTSLLALKALDSRQSGTVAQVVDAIEYAIEARRAGVNIRVLSSSWLSADPSVVLRDSIRRAGDAGMLFVTAAGDTGQDLDQTPLYPPNYDLPNLLVVTSVNNRDELPRLANIGVQTVHLAAPGASIVTTSCSPSAPPSSCVSGYRSYSGTRFAAAYVSGTAALVLAAPGNAALTPGQLLARLVGCGDHRAPLGAWTASGRRLNAAQAVTGCARVTVLPRAGGTVALAPSGPGYAYGDRVSVTATPDSGAVFAAWDVNGVAAGSDNPLALTVDQALTVRARYTFRLDMGWSAGGTVSVSPDAPSYEPGATVVATAVATPGFRFVGWLQDGATAGTNSTLSVTMDKPHTLYATFEALPAPATPPGTANPPPATTPPPPVPTAPATPAKPMPGIGSWSSWQAQGGVLTDAPAAAAFGGRFYVFARGLDNALYVKSSADATYWTEWQWLGGVLTAAPAAASTSDRLYVLARGVDSAMYIMSTRDGVTFTDWRGLGGVLNAPPAAASLNGRLFMFATGADNALYVMISSTGEDFGTWSRVGGVLTTGPAATSFLDQVHVYVRGSDGALYETVTRDGTDFSSWQSRGGVLLAAPAAAAAAPTGGPPTLYLLATGADGALYERHSLDGASYTGWRSLGGRLVGPPAAAGAVRFVAFARWIDNAVYERHTPP